MNDTDTLLVMAVVAASASMLAWFVIDLGTVTLAKYRAIFTSPL